MLRAGERRALRGDEALGLRHEGGGEGRRGQEGLLVAGWRSPQAGGEGRGGEGTAPNESEAAAGRREETTVRMAGVLPPAPGPAGGKGSEEKRIARGRGCGRRTGRGEREEMGGKKGWPWRGPPGERGWRSQRMVWKEALGRRSKLSPSCSGCSSLSSSEFAEPFMSPVPSRPLPSRSLPLLRALPPGALPGAECSRETAPGPAAAAAAAAGTARRGRRAEQGLLSRRRGRGSLEGRLSQGRWHPALPALGRAEPGRAGPEGPPLP